MNAVLTTPEASPASSCLDVTHGGEERGVERHPRAETEQDHGREHVDEHVSVDRSTREGAEAERGQPEARRERQPEPKRMTIFADRPIENTPIIRLAGRKARPTWSGLYPSTSCR